MCECEAECEFERALIERKDSEAMDAIRLCHRRGAAVRLSVGLGMDERVQKLWDGGHHSRENKRTTENQLHLYIARVNSHSEHAKGGLQLTYLFKETKLVKQRR